MIILTHIEYPRDIKLTSADVLATGREAIESLMLRRLMSLASCLVDMGVKFVGCQKIIHPLVKDYWRDMVWKVLTYIQVQNEYLFMRR